MEALNSIQEPIVFPVHPRTQAALKQGGHTLGKHVQAVPPAGYFDMLSLQKNARMVLTDSGGMQKEAYSLGTPCITLRDETEWVETVEAGWNTLVGADLRAILHAVLHFHAPLERPALYGDGKTSMHIMNALERFAPQ